MASPNVHNVEGRSCAMCGHKFTPQSMTLCINWRDGNLIIRKRVCGKCHNEWHSKGE